MRLILVMFFLVLSIIFQPSTAQESETIKILPTDDSYVTGNPDNENAELDSTNTGDSEILKIWYAWDYEDTDGLLMTIAYLKFDLSDIDPEKISTVTLYMHANKVELQNIDPSINIYATTDDSWNESKLAFDNKPQYAKEPISHSIISASNTWYSWDVSDFAIQNAGDVMSLAAAFDIMYQEHEESVVFDSKETMEKEFLPYIQVEFNYDNKSDVEELQPHTEERTPSDTGGCLIATATYGTELAPQIQQLRELRDHTILNTESGKSFLESFNSFYYAFSPYIADYERQNPAFKEMVKLAITPLVTSLSVLNHAEIDTEAEMISYGTTIIILNGMMYGVIPAVTVMQIRKVLCN